MNLFLTIYSSISIILKQSILLTSRCISNLKANATFKEHRRERKTKRNTKGLSMLYHRGFLIMFKKMLCKLVKHKSMFKKILDKPNKVLCKLTEHKKTLKRRYVNYWHLSNKGILDKLKKKNNAKYWEHLFSPITNFPKDKI